MEESTAHYPLVSTQAIIIYKPKQEIWPWLAQIGQSKAGFYNPAYIERWLKVDTEHKLRLNPIHQRLSVGEALFIHPKIKPLKLKGFHQYQWVAFSGWYFELKEINAQSTRLICRLASPYRPNLGPFLNLVFWHFIFEVAYYIFTRNLLNGIKQLSEGSESTPDPEQIGATG